MSTSIGICCKPEHDDSVLTSHLILLSNKNCLQNFFTQRSTEWSYRLAQHRNQPTIQHIQVSSNHLNPVVRHQKLCLRVQILISMLLSNVEFLCMSCESRNFVIAVVIPETLSIVWTNPVDLEACREFVGAITNHWNFLISWKPREHLFIRWGVFHPSLNNLPCSYLCWVLRFVFESYVIFALLCCTTSMLSMMAHSPVMFSKIHHNSVPISSLAQNKTGSKMPFTMPYFALFTWSFEDWQMVLLWYPFSILHKASQCSSVKQHRDDSIYFVPIFLKSFPTQYHRFACWRYDENTVKPKGDCSNLLRLFPS